MKAWQQAASGNSLTPTVSYLSVVRSGRRSPPWDNTIEGIIAGFERVAAGYVWFHRIRGLRIRDMKIKIQSAVTAATHLSTDPKVGVLNLTYSFF